MQEEIIEFMDNAVNYPEKTNSVERKQTHISNVFLTDNFVYKIKKPVNFGFLNFEDLEKRKFYCNEEVRLNKRLCPEIYLGVVPITKTENGLEIEGDGEAVEYAVKMKRMPEEAIMKKRLENDEIEYQDIKRISKKLSCFYQNAERSEEINSYGSIENIKNATDENFEQTKKYVGDIFNPEKYEFIKNATNRFYEDKQGLFEQRIKRGRIVAYHGDLHSGNIFVDGKNICIFDCIEFNKPFRFGDIAGDIGFLAMDLEFMDKCYLSKYLIKEYVDLTNDYNIYTILDFYKCYRAYVRAKISAFMQDDENIAKERKNELREDARKYFELAYRYAKIFDNQKPTVMISCGVTATGKSRWLKVASDIMNSAMLRTDEIRKELLDIKDDEARDEEFYKKYYSEEKRQMVYDEIFKRAENIIKNGGKVAIDASFIKKKNRELAKKIAEKHNAEFIIIHTTASEDTIKKRLKQRMHEEENISDADFENAYKFQVKNFEAPEHVEGTIISLDTEKNDFENIKKLRGELGEIFNVNLVSGLDENCD